MIPRRAPAALLALVAVTLASTGCKTTGEYVWADALPPTPQSTSRDYVIQPGDTISIRVWGQDQLTVHSRVRPDGRVSMPFLGDVDAAGNAPTALATKVQTRLKDFFVNPAVTVTLELPRPAVVSVIGEVVRPGSYPLEQGAGILQALASAGGMTPFADRDWIIVLRQKPDGSGTQRIRSTYDSLIRLQGGAATFRLQGGDVVVVE